MQKQSKKAKNLMLFHCFVIKDKGRQKWGGWLYIPLGALGSLRNSKDLLKHLTGAPSLWQALQIR